MVYVTKSGNFLTKLYTLCWWDYLTVVDWVVSWTFIRHSSHVRWDATHSKSNPVWIFLTTRMPHHSYKYIRYLLMDLLSTANYWLMIERSIHYNKDIMIVIISTKPGPMLLIMNERFSTPIRTAFGFSTFSWWNKLLKFDPHINVCFISTCTVTQFQLHQMQGWTSIKNK